MAAARSVSPGQQVTLWAVATTVTPRPALGPGAPVSDIKPSPLGARLRVLAAPGGVALAMAAVVVGCVLRFIAPAGLWLDETLSVNISRLPLTQIPGALVQDGSPPLYYYLLHYWMLVFGQGDFAVRALSGVVSVSTLPLMWAAGRRAGGRAAGWAALLLVACSPWAIYYATDTRMYSLMAFEAVAFYLIARRALEFPSRGRLVAVTLITAALMYTHYWDLYLVVAGGAWALWRAWRERRTGRCPAPAYPKAARKIVLAMAVGGVLWLPWAPVFVFQALHTGTPWTSPPGPENLLSVFSYFGGVGYWGTLLTFILFASVALAAFGRPGPSSTSVVIEARVQERSSFVLFLVLGTLGTAVAAGMLTGAAFDNRYIAVVFPLFILVCALGVSNFGARTMVSGTLAVACVAGVFAARVQNAQPRTQAVVVAADLNRLAQPGDMVLYCPDQLGPAVDRLLTVPNVTEVSFPRMNGPQRIDWVDYTKTIKATDVYAFAQAVISRLSAGSTLWLVWRDGYTGLGGDCGELNTWLTMKLGAGYTVVKADSSYYEYENLVRFSS